MNIQTPVRLSAAEESLVAQLETAGAKDAAERLRVAGLPTRRVESYHYTDLKSLLGSVPPMANAANDASAPAIDIPGAYRIVIANGVVQSSATAPAGVIVGKAHGSVLTTRDDVIVRLNAALDESIRVGLEMGGTITGEHGVGQYKLRWLGLEQPEPVRELQRRIKELFDPAGILNPGKAI